ncbi:MAG: bifunctional [glutamate--ammonia ligase]-adenylyl-L-tyrosine phosphorylase/[glutamate--ammonia-ligase] adenylyltransferase [Nitrospirota bacterium]
MLFKKAEDAASNTPDPLSAGKNLIRFFESNSETYDFLPYINETALLFASSQFLSNYCIGNPQELLSALKEMDIDITGEALNERAEKELLFSESRDINSMMKGIRLFKKRHLLRITLRDLAKRTDIISSMNELTRLAEVVISTALNWAMKLNIEKFGEPSDEGLSLISFGKLGGGELNYSSDVDLMAVYRTEEGQTSGVTGPAGVTRNRLSNHEFFCKVVELFSKLLSSHTEDGIAYRVDLRLRPQGQKGELALPLSSYKTYYESWGRTWERMALIRARPVAGDTSLGEAFIQSISPFVWKETVDFTEIEEIRGLKKKIDSTFTEDDIKRGYGGIREAEFFIQTFLLIYGGQERSLRTNNFLHAIDALQKMEKLPAQDLMTIRDNYLYLRRLEHYLQMKDDLQTHKLPSSETEELALAKKMGFASRDDFISNLRLRRIQVKNMYNTLLGTEEDVYAETLTVLERGLSDEEMAGYLAFRNIRDIDSGIKHMKRIREQITSFKTQGERAALKKVVPEFLEKAFGSESPDRALSGLDSILPILGQREACLSGIAEQKRLVEIIVRLFSLSPYLSAIFLSNEGYLGRLIEGLPAKKSLNDLMEELRGNIIGKPDFLNLLEEYKRAEELRIWILFLMGNINVEDLFRHLSHLAEAVIRIIMKSLEVKEGITVIGFGKLGGRELNFVSDLDIIFVTERLDRDSEAQAVLKSLTTYTDRGMLYDVDVRLRPDGTKGSLVKDIEGYRNYYLKKAHAWELQALLRARPVAGDMKLGREFLKMASAVLIERGPSVSKKDVVEMREKITRELSREAEGIDIKLGPGGIEEIEFYIQHLQLHNAKKHPDILLQNTASAIKRLGKRKILTGETEEALLNSYAYFRKLETFMRMNDINTVAEGSDVTKIAGLFMEHGSTEEFLSYLRAARERVLAVVKSGLR